MTKPKTQQSKVSVKATPAIIEWLFIFAFYGYLLVTLADFVIATVGFNVRGGVTFAEALIPIVMGIGAPFAIGAVLYLSRRDRSNSLKMWFEISIVLASTFLIFALSASIFWRVIGSVSGQYYNVVNNYGLPLIAALILALIIPRLRATKQW